MTALLELLDIARGGGQGHLVGEQEVLRVALGDIDDVALAALTPELIREDDFHGILLLRPGVPALVLPRVVLDGDRLATVEVANVAPHVHESHDAHYDELHLKIQCRDDGQSRHEPRWAASSG